MKANELRIGNVIKSKSSATFWSVDIDDLILVNDNPEHYLPIPLTKEWLVKFGFKKVTENFYSIKTKKRFSNLEINLKTKRAIIFGLHSYKDILFPKYVHQLQNLYSALTGEELTLK